MKLSTKIFIGLGLGILTGLLFGETVAFLAVVGRGFVLLLQMPAIPFVVASLIYGLGSLTYPQAASLAKKCGAVLLVLWAIALAAVAMVPLAFPEWESASFFSSALIAEQRKIDFLGLYIPANPFHSLADGIVPAVVLFSVVVGVSLIGSEKKQPVLDLLSSLMDVLGRVTQLIVRLAPIGVFAIAAGAAGTLRPEELGRLQVYLLTFIAMAMVLSFWVLPALVTTVTPLRHAEVIGPIRSALVTAFATGNLLIVLPLLSERAGEVLRGRDLATDETDSTIGVIVPTAYTFPSVGLLLSMAFVPFAAWYVGMALSAAQYPMLLVSGLFSFFGGTVIAIPFLLDLLHIPADMFQLFLTIDVFTSRFGTLLAAMSLWVLTLLGVCAVTGHLKIRWNRMIRFGGTGLVFMGAVIGVMYATFTYGFDPEYSGYRSFVQMGISAPAPVSSRIREELPEPLSRDPARSRLDEIRERGYLRVAYTRDSLPFAFRNSADQLVGFDVDMAHRLARDLGVSLEFVVIDRDDHLIEQLERCCDVLMSGYAVTARRTERVDLSSPYLDTTLAFITPDHRRNQFNRWPDLRSREGLKLAIPAHAKYYRELLKQLLPEAELVPIGSPREYFRGGFAQSDALAFTAEGGSAWTLVYPSFSVTVPLPHPLGIPLAYPVPKGNLELVAYLSTWIELKRKDGTLDDLYRYWILGQGAEEKRPRWSIVRDVLGWID